MPQVLLLHDPPFLEKEQWISLLFYPVCWPDIYFFPKPHHFIDNLGTNNAQVLFEKMGPNVAIIHYKPTSLSSVYLSSIFHFVRDSCKGKKKKAAARFLMSTFSDQINCTDSLSFVWLWLSVSERKHSCFLSCLVTSYLLSVLVRMRSGKLFFRGSPCSSFLYSTIFSPVLETTVFKDAASNLGVVAPFLLFTLPRADPRPLQS